MPLPSGNIHLLRLGGNVQNSQLLAQPGGVAGLNSRLRAGKKKLLDAFVAEALDHPALL